jgi:hypothetical protein
MQKPQNLREIHAFLAFLKPDIFFLYQAISTCLLPPMHSYTFQQNLKFGADYVEIGPQNGKKLWLGHFLSVSFHFLLWSGAL